MREGVLDRMWRLEEMKSWKLLTSGVHMYLVYSRVCAGARVEGGV